MIFYVFVEYDDDIDEMYLIYYVFSLDNFCGIYFFVSSVKEGNFFFKWGEYVFVYVKYG